MTYQYFKDNNKINYNNLTIWNSEIYSGSCHKYNIIAMQIYQENYLDLVLCLLPDVNFYMATYYNWPKIVSYVFFPVWDFWHHNYTQIVLQT